MARGHRSISIKKPLVDQIEPFVNEGRYDSIAGFVSEAIRLRLEELRKAENMKEASNAR